MQAAKDVGALKVRSKVVRLLVLIQACEPTSFAITITFVKSYGAMATTQRTKLSERLYEMMRQRVQSGEWSEGTRIPTEMELAAQHSVSRPVVREALVRLRNDGIINSKRGSGSYVLSARDLPSRGFRQIENVADLIHAFEFRLSIECDAAAMAAARHDSDAFETLAAAHEAFGDGIDDTAFGDLDLGFHMAVAKASMNPMYSATMSMLHQQIVFGMRLVGQFSSSGTQIRLDVVRREHGLIVDAIAERDTERAYEAMFDHLNRSGRRLLGFDAISNWRAPRLPGPPGH